jgi:hypothetical protein
MTPRTGNYAIFAVFVVPTTHNYPVDKRERAANITAISVAPGLPLPPITRGAACSAKHKSANKG